MYVALQEMNVRMPDASVATLKIGDAIPGFEGWPTWTQKAMIEGSQVRWAPGGLAPHEIPAEIVPAYPPVPLGPLGPPAREAKDDRPHAVETYVPGRDHMLENVSAEAVDSEAPPAPAPRPKVAKPKEGETIFKAVNAQPLDPSVKSFTEPPTNKGAHDCPQCDRKGFKDLNGLKVHLSRAHKD